MSKRTARALALLACVLGILGIGMASAEETVQLADIGLQTVFPDGWTVITRDNARAHHQLLGASSAKVVEEKMRVEGLYAVAVSPAGDAMLRVLAQTGDETVALYHDIERYSAEMRTAIRKDFLDKEAWALTGYRYTEAEWTNKKAQGRLLNLSYTIRAGEEITARGTQAYTVHNGLAITLDLRVTGRKIEKADEKAFAAMLAGTVFPESVDYPLLPVALVFTSGPDEETHKADQVVRGETLPGAAVSVWVLDDQDDRTLLGEAKANASGVFRLEFTLPWEGDLRLYFAAELEGHETANAGRWISYDSKRLPVSFTSRPSGDCYESQVIISGKTISGVKIQCMEGDDNKKTTTGSDGTFSFKMDRAAVGDRTVTLAFSKKGFNDRREEITFNRQWTREDLAKYLDDQVQSLSYEKLTGTPEKFIGRQVKYSATVLGVSGETGVREYVELGVKQSKEGKWIERIVAVADNTEVPLRPGDAITVYFAVTGESFTFSDEDGDGNSITVDLPAVQLLTYIKN